MTFTKVILALACLMSGTLVAQEAKVTELLSKDLTNLPGKEGLMVMVEYPPGSSDPIHRHNAHGFIYVLEGSIVMQVRGGKEVTLTPGQTFYEGPDDVHVVGRNASKTEPASDSYELKASCAISSCVGDVRRPVYFPISHSPVVTAAMMSATSFMTLLPPWYFFQFPFRGAGGSCGLSKPGFETRLAESCVIARKQCFLTDFRSS